MTKISAGATALATLALTASSAAPAGAQSSPNTARVGGGQTMLQPRLRRRAARWPPTACSVSPVAPAQRRLAAA